MKSAAEKYKAKQRARGSNASVGQAKAEGKARKRKAFRRKHPKKVLARTQGVADAQERTRDALAVDVQPSVGMLPRGSTMLALMALGARRRK